ncbi:MAG TPA: DUF4416 family protein [Candidatus Deferrimicrobium sp.]|nr:DUF4416 family protein [Candidatus Deferrimicrobium sp.]
MARSQRPAPGRLIVSTIYSSLDALAESLPLLERRFGRVQFETVGMPCSEVELYKEEMGSDLQRRFFCFEQPVERDSLPEIKKICHKIEPLFADRSGDFIFRTVNIDPGILVPDNLVMASHRDDHHRVYLRDGVFAEIVLIYVNGRFARLPWTSTDFCHDEAIDLFLRVRGSFEEAEPADHVEAV